MDDAVVLQTGVDVLKRRLLLFALFNLFLVSLSGLLLRSFPFLSHPFFDFRKLVHGHSHFAFGGWLIPVQLWMVLHYFPELKGKIALRHWRNIVFILLLSAYGMLASFPFQGYGPVSIFFSTASIAGSVYLAVVIRKATRENRTATSIRFLRAGLFFGVLSAIGPLATGPLIAAGKAGTPLYFDAIYFFLHFQYNGWFVFTLLAIAYAVLEKKGGVKNGTVVFRLFHLALVPTYFLSILWHHPHPVFYGLGGTAALVQLAALYLFCRERAATGKMDLLLRVLLWLSLASLVLKSGLQFFSAFPSVADLAYGHRNFIIAYLHLVLIGCLGLAALLSVLHAYPFLRPVYKKPLLLFAGAFAVTEILLVLQALLSVMNRPFPSFSFLIFTASCMLPLSAFYFYFHAKRHLEDSMNGAAYPAVPQTP